MMNKKERDEYVLAGLRGYATLERRNTDEIGWIALKLGCTRAQAEKAIKSARQSEEGAIK